MGKAVLLTEFADDEACFTFTTRDIGDKKIQANRVLVEVKACGITHLDAEARQGNFTMIQGDLPYILGYEISGIVRGVGEDVIRFAIGDPVVAMIPMDHEGGNAEYVLIEDYFLVKKPESVPWNTAAAAITSGMRAQLIFHLATRSAAGDSVLILQANLFSQRMAAQVALSIGLKVFVVYEGSSASLGFPSGIIEIKIDKNTDLIQRIELETSGLGVDMILEPPALLASHIYPTNTLISCMGLHAIWITSRTLQIDPPTSQLLLFRCASIRYIFSQSWVLSSAQQGRFLHLLEDLLKKIAKTEIQCIVDKVFPLECISEAHSFAQENPNRKVIVEINT